jgi:hypothetical protein
MSADDLTRAIARLERRIHEEHPEVRHVFIEAEALTAQHSNEGASVTRP